MNLRPTSLVLALTATVSLSAISCSTDDTPEKVDPCGWSSPDIETFEQCATFNFGIFSDNKGDSAERKVIATMMQGMKDMKAPFVLGLGDHVRGPKKEEEPFVKLIKSDSWWHDNFYPTIADGENAYYGKGQWDWGAGKGLLDDLEACKRSNVKCRKNGVEYHATWTVEGITVHYISAHYPDQGDDPFPDDSQQYLVDEVNAIQRDGHQIVIAAAHTDDWLKKMPEQRREVMLSKADLLLGATTHVYMRYNYPDDKALFLNTGSTGYAPLTNNYLQVSVLQAPLRIVVQNMNAAKERHLQKGTACWVKQIGGNISACHFENAKSWL